MEKKYYITTYGCQMNLHESEKIAGILTGMGYTEAEDEKTADIIVFNTCCIRENAEDRAYGNIGALKKLKREKPSLLIAVGGCMTQQPDAAEKLHRSCLLWILFSGRIISSGSANWSPNVYRKKKP